MASTDTRSEAGGGGSDIDTRAVIGFLATYAVVAFVLMALVSFVVPNLYLRGIAFLIAHALGAAAGYRLFVAPQVDAGVGDFASQVEKLGAGYGVFAVLKHVLLLVLGRAGDALGGLDRALVWVVDAAYLNTSLLPDVAALGVIALTVHAAERARK